MVISKNKKLKKRILDSLSKVELSLDEGRLISTPFKLSCKNKKHSGRYTPSILKMEKFSEIFARSAQCPQKKKEVLLLFND